MMSAALTHGEWETSDDMPSPESVMAEMNLPRHRASTDARVLQMTYLRLIGTPPLAGH